MIDGTGAPDGVDVLLSAFGFSGRALPLDTASRTRLGIAEVVLAARVSIADGALRALSVEIAREISPRDCIEHIARELTRRAPQLLWLVVAVQRDGDALGIATWRSGGSAPRVAAMLTERGSVVDSDAETVCALSAATAASGDVMRHMRWLDILGRDAVTRRFFRALSASVATLSSSLGPAVPPADRHQIALLTTSRLLFLSFLETKGWLNGDFGFIANGFADCMAKGGGYQRRVLEPLFFGTLNTRVSERAQRARAFGRIPFLNGGLFSRTSVERIHRHARLTDDAIGALFGDVLVRYRFTAREDAATWSQAAIDPEMLGKVFESLMESRDRKRDGVYYTPYRFVERVTLLTLRAVLERHGVPRERAERLLNDEGSACEPDSALLEQVRALRILDPACGSGAFLVHALERVARLRISLGETAHPSEVRRAVLTQSIFGVDSSATAVWLCELRLWLSTVIDSDERNPMRVTPLPNLDRQIRIGDSLSGVGFNITARSERSSPTTSALRDRYACATGRRKAALGRRLDVVERTRAIAAIDSALIAAEFERREIIRAARARDLFEARTPPPAKRRDRILQLRDSIRELRRRRVRVMRGETPAFSYRAHFADVAASGGFDVIVGNPPWVRMHNMKPADRARYRENFELFRSSGWADGARGAKAASGFASQTDLAALFLERSTDLLAVGGTLGLLLPSKLWHSLAGGGARHLMLKRSRIVAIEDHADGPNAFEAVVYPCTFVATRRPPTPSVDDHAIEVAVQKRKTTHRWSIPSRNLSLDSSPGSPWLLLPSDARASFDCLTSAGVPLFESVLRRPHLGVKTGCNEAYIVHAGTDDDGLTRICANDRHGAIESRSLRPLVRGETLDRWRLVAGSERIIWTHDSTGTPATELPARAHHWLAHWRRTLERRSDSRTERWWSLFRVDAARSEMARVVWCDFGREPRAAVIDAGDPTVPLNSCYCIQCTRTEDALAFCALLNSDIAAAWLAVLAEPARGGYHRYLGWTVARLPIPIDWPRARRLLAPIAEDARSGRPPSACTLRDAVLTAYDLDLARIESLLMWTDARADR
jgi:hypothetical protein